MAWAEMSKDGMEVLVRFEYSPNIIAELKDELPSWTRGWDNKLKCWRISIDFWYQARRIFEKYHIDFGTFDPAKRASTGDEKRKKADKDFDDFIDWMGKTWSSANNSGPTRTRTLTQAGIRRVQLDQDLMKLFLIPGAPPEVITAVYRALAMLYHPDHNGGSEEKMKELNIAYSKLKAKGLVK